jgi:hypothetical protein
VDTTDVLELAKRFPEVVLREGPSWTSITFKGKGFGWVKHEENTAQLKITHGERTALLATDPTTYAEGWASGSTAWVLVELSSAEPDVVLELLAEGWRMTATKRVVAAFDAAHDGGLPTA